MTRSEIAKQIKLDSFFTHRQYYWVLYFFGEKKVNLTIYKDSESDLLELVEGEMCQFEALSIAILNEVQKEAKATEHRAEEAVSNVPDVFNEIFHNLGLIK